MAKVSIIMSVILDDGGLCNVLNTIVVNSPKQAPFHLFLDTAVKTVALPARFDRFSGSRRQKPSILDHARLRKGWPRQGPRADCAAHPKGALGKSKLDGKEEEIRILLQKQVPRASIAKTVSVSRTALHHFIDSRNLDPKASQPQPRAHRP